MEFENLLALIKAVSDSELSELHYEENGANVHLVKAAQKSVPVMGVPYEGTAPVFVQNVAEQEPPAAHSGKSETMTEGKIVKSPLVGTFYAAPSEDAEPFVAAGDRVTKGKILGIVEAMKLMNEIECEFEGTVAEILVENGQMVEFGQPLFRIV